MVNCAKRCVPFSRAHHVESALQELLGSEAMSELRQLWRLVETPEVAEVEWRRRSEEQEEEEQRPTDRRHVVEVISDMNGKADLEIPVHNRAQLALWLQADVREKRLQVLQLDAPEWTYRGWLFPDDHETWFRCMYMLRCHPGPWNLVEVGGAALQPGRLAQCDWSTGGRTLLLSAMAQSGPSGSALYTVGSEPLLPPEQQTSVSSLAEVPAPWHLLYLRQENVLDMPIAGWSDGAVVVTAHPERHAEQLKASGFAQVPGVRRLWQPQRTRATATPTEWTAYTLGERHLLRRRPGKPEQRWEEDSFPALLEVLLWDSARQGEWVLLRSAEYDNQDGGAHAAAALEPASAVALLAGSSGSGSGSRWPAQAAVLSGPELDRLMDARVEGPEHSVEPAPGEKMAAGLLRCGWVSVQALREAAAAAGSEEDGGDAAPPSSVRVLFERLHRQPGACVCVGGVF